VQALVASSTGSSRTVSRRLGKRVGINPHEFESRILRQPEQGKHENAGPEGPAFRLPASPHRPASAARPLPGLTAGDLSRPAQDRANVPWRCPTSQKSNHRRATIGLGLGRHRAERVAEGRAIEAALLDVAPAEDSGSNVPARDHGGFAAPAFGIPGFHLDDFRLAAPPFSAALPLKAGQNTDVGDHSCELRQPEIVDLRFCRELTPGFATTAAPLSIADMAIPAKTFRFKLS